MKYLFFAFTILFLLHNCEKEKLETVEVFETVSPFEDLVQADQKDKLVKFLVSKGFDLATIYENEDVVIVEGDMVYDKNSSSEYIEGDEVHPEIDPVKQRRSTTLSDYSMIYYYVQRTSNGVTFSTQWREAIKDAFEEYNDLAGNNLFFVKTTSPSFADITVMPYNDCSSSIGGFASFPSSGNPGSTINLNVCKTSRFVISFHEIGHTIGLHHTDGANGTHIPGSCYVDANSVMNAGISSGTTITACDVYSIGHLYPAIGCSPPSAQSDWLISPNGGELFIESEDDMTIIWNENDLGWGNTTVRLQLYYYNALMRHGGSSSGLILDEVVPNTGSYTWSVPSLVVTGDYFRVKIINPFNDCVYDFSDGYFEIQNN
jgi:hypothetical protein